MSSNIQAVSRGPDWFWLVLLFVPPLLIFPNLGDIYLWQDEAETALLGRAILQHGYPLAQDGLHLISVEPNHLDLNENGVWIWSPWLPFYLVAASFALLGESTWSARLPFALVGWGALCIAYAFFRDLTRNTWVSRLAVILMLTSVPFLLHLRQCRYYMLLTLFTLLHLWGYTRMARADGKRAAMFALGGIGLFHTFFPQLVASTAGMVLHALWLNGDRRLIRRFVKWSLVIATTSLPFFLYSRGWSREYAGTGHGFDNLWRYAASLKVYFLYVHIYAWPFILAIPLAWRAGSRWRPLLRRLWRGGLLATTLAALLAVTRPPSRLSLSLFLVTMLLASGAGLGWLYELRRKGITEDVRAQRGWPVLVGLVLMLSVATYAAIFLHPFFRYLIGVVPLLALVTAAMLVALAPRRRWVAVLLAAAIIFSEFIQFGPFFLGTHWGTRGEKMSLASIREMTAFGHAPTNLANLILLRLSPNAQAFRSLPREYFREITHDYSGPIEGTVKYLETNARPGESLVTTSEHFPLMFYTELRIYRDRETEGMTRLPDWIFIHGPSPPQLSPGLQQALRTRYLRIEINAPENPWENIPEPDLHQFITPEGRAPVLLRRKDL